MVDDCASLCTSETLFKCSAYTFAGAGSYCVLHGQIDKSKVTKKLGSSYSITDLDCVNGNVESTRLKLCSFDLLETGVSLEVLSGEFKKMSAMSRQHCEIFCSMGLYGSTCTSYVFDPSVSSIGNTNCILISRDNSTTTIFNPGTAEFYENPCSVEDVS